MREITTHKHRQAVQRLPFCYLCGLTIEEDDVTDGDHVPPKCVFAKSDREPLILPTHVRCNNAHKLADEKIGQLIALRRGAAPRPENRRLRVRHLPAGVALWNLDIDVAVWRWIAGFRAALYREPLHFSETGKPTKLFCRSLVLPFPKAPKDGEKIEPLLPQHLRFVETVKSNRIRKNVDHISCNKGQLTYACVWDRLDNVDRWICIFALNVCDWKVLGGAPGEPSRGCAGCYMLHTEKAPDGASLAIGSPIILPNRNRLDPFAP